MFHLNGLMQKLPMLLLEVLKLLNVKMDFQLIQEFVLIAKQVELI